MSEYDLCLAWSWEYDLGFVELVRRACESIGARLIEATPQSLQSVLEELRQNVKSFGALLDRASDCDETFLELDAWAVAHQAKRLNRRELAVTAWNKAVVHSLFQSSGIPVPHTIVLPPFVEQPELSVLDLSRVGSAFTIKPARQGGGDGVVLQATSWQQVLAARTQFPCDEYLIQSSVVPADLNCRPAWFRVLHCFDHAYPCWWNQRTHVYAPVTEQEEKELNLAPLQSIVSRIADTCGLELFSTEVALAADGEFWVVDYVNDPVDLRLQSQAADGVPDWIVQTIAARIATWATEPRSLILGPPQRT